MLFMVSILLNLLTLVLCPIMWSVFENVPCAFEKNVFCLKYTSVKVPYYNCVAVNIFLEVLQDFLNVFGCSYVGCIYIYNVYIFLVDSSFEYKWPSGSLFMALLWKSIFSDMSIATPAFFFLFAWKICFEPFTFSLCRSFVLRWGSCREHMCGSFFLIHSAILHVLKSWFGGHIFFEASFVWKTPYLAFHFNWELCWIK